MTLEEVLADSKISNTMKAVFKFQKEVFPNDKSEWDGLAGKKTINKIIEKLNPVDEEEQAEKVRAEEEQAEEVRAEEEQAENVTEKDESKEKILEGEILKLAEKLLGHPYDENIRGLGKASRSTKNGSYQYIHEFVSDKVFKSKEHPVTCIDVLLLICTMLEIPLDNFGLNINRLTDRRVIKFEKIALAHPEYFDIEPINKVFTCNNSIDDLNSKLLKPGSFITMKHAEKKRSGWHTGVYSKNGNIIHASGTAGKVVETQQFPF